LPLNSQTKKISADFSLLPEETQAALLQTAAQLSPSSRALLPWLTGTCGHMVRTGSIPGSGVLLNSASYTKPGYSYTASLNMGKF